MNKLKHKSMQYTDAKQKQEIQQKAKYDLWIMWVINVLLPRESNSDVFGETLWGRRRHQRQPKHPHFRHQNETVNLCRDLHL